MGRRFAENVDTAIASRTATAIRPGTGPRAVIWEGADARSCLDDDAHRDGDGGRSWFCSRLVSGTDEPLQRPRSRAMGPERSGDALVRQPDAARQSGAVVLRRGGRLLGRRSP